MSDEIKPVEPEPHPPAAAPNESPAQPPLTPSTGPVGPVPQAPLPELSQATRPGATSTSNATPAGNTFDPQREQRANRAENADYMKVLQVFGQMPLAYAEHLNAAGDVNFNFGQSATTRTTPPQRDGAEVLQHELRLIRSVYQTPAQYLQALAVLRDKRCVVLRGRPQVGKRAAAIRLALELDASRESPDVRELSPDDDLLAQLEVSQIRPGTVYLVDGLLREAARAVKPHRARTLASDLAARQSYLVVCARPDVSLPEDWPAVTLEPPTVSADVLVAAHLDFYGPFALEQVQNALALPAIQELLVQGLLPCQAEQLARQIARAFQEGQPVETALRGFAAAAEGAVESWFDEAGDNLDERAYRIALAVFNGARYVSVLEAGRGLAKRLEEPEDPSDEDKKTDTVPRPRTAWFEKRGDRLSAARARLSTRVVTTEYSESASIEIVELTDIGFSSALLKHLWQELDDLRQPLLTWLSAHAVTGPHDMRLRAAGALGALAGIDASAFEYMRAAVFRPWALDNLNEPDRRRRQHQALGNAFGVLIWNELRADDVLGLLADWSNFDTQPALQWAAARAYAQVGLRYPGKAIGQWRHILNASKDRFVLRLTEDLVVSLPDLPLQMSVIDAIFSLFLRAAELPHRLKRVYEQALEALAAWVEADGQDRKAVQAGLPLFLALTQVRLPPEDGRDAPEEWPPAMLYLIGTQPEPSYRRALAGMLRRALAHPGHGPTALAALHAWTKHAERDAWLEGTLIALLREIWHLADITPREKQRLTTHLTRWQRHPRNPLAVAGRILASLDRPLLEDSHGT